MTRIAVVDYGMGNLRSVAKALEHVAPHAQVQITGDPAQIAWAYSPGACCAFRRSPCAWPTVPA
jgi:hypothetical protein